MTWHTATRSALCLTFVAVFSILLAKSRPVLPPGDPSTKAVEPLPNPLLPHDDNRGTAPIWMRHAPPLTATIAESLPTTRPADPTASTVLPDGPATPKVRTYLVRRGDTLGRIARRFYGRSDPQVINRILHHNKDRIKDRNTILAGQELEIPELTRENPEKKIGATTQSVFKGQPPISSAEFMHRLLGTGSVVHRESPNPNPNPNLDPDMIDCFLRDRNNRFIGIDDDSVDQGIVIPAVEVRQLD